MSRPTKEFQTFDQAMRQLLTVPRATIVERMAVHREKSAQNPRKRGPKPKVKPSSATDPGEGSGS